MKKIFVTLLVLATMAASAQEVGSAGKLLRNELKKSNTNVNVNINIDYRWEQDYRGGYSEVFIRIPEMGRFTVQLGDQEITNSNGMFRFFDVRSGAQPLSIYGDGLLLYRVTLRPRNEMRLVLDFFSRQGLFLLEEVNLGNAHDGYYGRQWNDVWNRSYGGASMMRGGEFARFYDMYKKQSFDNDKINFFRMQKNAVSFTTEQVSLLMKEMSFDDNKLIIAKEAYPNVVDPKNYYLLHDSFDFSLAQKRFADFLQSVRR